MDISWKQAGLGLCTIVCLTAIIRPSAFDEPVPVTVTTRTIPATTPKKAEPSKKPLRHMAPVQPDGYLSEEDCAGIPTGMKIADLVWKFGWPEGGHAAFSDQLYYTIREHREDVCLVEYEDNKVTSTLYRED